MATWSPGDLAWYWNRKAGERARRLHVTVIAVDNGYVDVQLPPGWTYPTRRIRVDRLHTSAELPPELQRG